MTPNEQRNAITTRKPNILIVEDDDQIRLLLCTILEQLGYSVRPAPDGVVALEELRTEVPDILLSDLYMPRMSGFELLPVVRQEFPVTRVVAMSSTFSGSDDRPGLLPTPSMQKPPMLLPCYRSSKRWPGPIRRGRAKPFANAPPRYESCVDPSSKTRPDRGGQGAVWYSLRGFLPCTLPQIDCSILCISVNLIQLRIRELKLLRCIERVVQLLHAVRSNQRGGHPLAA
jgi:CheY-like chemotaxis protein